jgi:hypothetical protein
VVSQASPIAGDDTDPSNCLIYLSDVASPPAFADYPASVRHSTGFAKPRLTSADGKRYRTAIREGAAAGPNFAGHYAVVSWGCGSSCNDGAIVDMRSGSVTFDSRIRDVYTGHVGDFNGAGVHLDSRLLVIEGMPQEDESRDGVTYFEWTGSRLKLIRFVPRIQACREAP